MMINAGQTLDSAKQFARKYSEDNPGQYVTLFANFGIYISVSKRLGTFAPSDSIGGVYWFNGREKPFTSAQQVADQNATPTLS